MACWVKGCRALARYTPILRVAQRDTEHVSPVALPVRLCATHRGVFPGMFLTTERRATMEDALRSRGRAAPDWSRTAVEFEDVVR
jgi:hypothetical protein